MAEAAAMGVTRAAQELRITIDFGAIRLARLPRPGLPGIYQKPTELDKNDRIGFWFSLLVLLAERTQHEYPDTLEPDTQFVMGGRPRSNRQH